MPEHSTDALFLFTFVFKQALIPFIIVTCSCNRLSELKRTIELRAEAKECLKRGEITNVNNLDGLSIVKLEEVANEMKEWETEERFFP